MDTDYNEESFFVRHAYFSAANGPYKAADADSVRRLATRVLLRKRLGAPRPRGFKELLAACPLGTSTSIAPGTSAATSISDVRHRRHRRGVPVLGPRPGGVK